MDVFVITVCISVVPRGPVVDQCPNVLGTVQIEQQDGPCPKELLI